MINEDINLTLDDLKGKVSDALMGKIEYSVNLMRKAEGLAKAYDPDNGYYLAFSGGKDSQALWHMAKLAGVPFKAHMSLTSVDPPEVIRFVRKQYPTCDFKKPKWSIFQRAVELKILPTRRIRWCCADFKEHAGAGKVTLIGIRNEESFRRKQRKEVEINGKKFSGTFEELDGYREERVKNKRKSPPLSIVTATGERTLGCITGKESLLISPIIHWTEKDVWEFLNAIGAKHCELYDQGWKRLGCIHCPMANHKWKIIENERWPHVKRNWIKAIIAIRRGGGISRTAMTEQSFNPGGANKPTVAGFQQTGAAGGTSPSNSKRGYPISQACQPGWTGFRKTPRLTAQTRSEE